ncbi:MAG: response regulator [Planctomycetota bacterium]|nr:response regulator [Planctomycetota bacterium]
MAERAKIILIDDDHSTRFYVKHKLQAQYELESYESWSQAWQSLKDCDLILLDVQLKGLKGNDISKLIKDKFSKQGISNPPLVVFFSCLDEVKLAALSEDCGVDGYIIKDFSTGDLCKKIDTFLSGKTSKRKGPSRLEAPKVSSPGVSLEDESTESLLLVLKEGNFLKRAGAIFVLGKRQPLEERVAVALNMCLKDDKSVVRNAAKAALARSSTSQ